MLVNDTNLDRINRIRDTRYYDAFKSVRNRIQKHNPPDILMACIRKLREYDAAYGDKLLALLKVCPAWFLFHLIKWTIVYGNFATGHRNKPLSERDFNFLVHKVHQLSSKVRLPNEFGSLFLFFRCTAYQQFWIQESISRDCIGRQSFLFGNLEINHTFQSDFLDETGVSIADFIELGFALIAAFLRDQRMFVTVSYFSKGRDSFPPNSIENFLNALAATPAELRDYLMGLEEERCKSAYEYYERTPLTRYPLLQIEDQYFCYSVSLLHQVLHSFIYDTLRRRDPAAFMGKFAPIFERYVQKGLEYASLTFIDEAKIKRVVGLGQRVVDFFVYENDANVLIDAKGVEINQLGMISYRPDIVTDKVEQSVVKGVIQGIETANALATSEDYRSRTWDPENNFLLVVTFKELYVGNGIDFYNGIAKKKLDQLFGEMPNAQIIPLENMYFISIDEFDWLVQILHEHNESIGSLMRYARKQDAEFKTQCFKFSQHLQKRYPNDAVPAYLTEEFERMTNRCIQRFN